MRKLTLCYVAIALNGIIPLAHADSYYDYRNGQRYMCTLDEEPVRNSCYDQPAREECSDWTYTGQTTGPNPFYMCTDPAVSCAPYNSYSRTCRTYDGCGNLSGSYSDSKSEVAPHWTWNCSPC